MNVKRSFGELQSTEEGKIVLKIWGDEHYICNKPEYCAKFLTVTAGYTSSEHRHDVKTESFYVLKGNGVITLDGYITKVKKGDIVHVRRGKWHCFATAVGMELFEISTHHDDQDVQRLSESHKLTQEGDGALWEALYR